MSFQTRRYDVSRDGTLAFVPPVVTQETGTLVWVDSSGSREVIARLERTVDLPRLSHDGTRVAFRSPAPNCDIWVRDLVRGSTTRLSSEGDNHGIVWSGDDERIATFRRGFATGRPIWLRADGAGTAGDLYPEDFDETFLIDVSPDAGRVFVGAQREGSSWDVSVIDVAARRLEPLFSSRFDETGAIHFLPKPFSLKQLAGKVKEVMEAPGRPEAGGRPGVRRGGAPQSLTVRS